MGKTTKTSKESTVFWSSKNPLNVFHALQQHLRIDKGHSGSIWVFLGSMNVDEVLQGLGHLGRFYQLWKRILKSKKVKVKTFKAIPLSLPAPGSPDCISLLTGPPSISETSWTVDREKEIKCVLIWYFWWILYKDQKHWKYMRGEDQNFDNESLLWVLSWCLMKGDMKTNI